MLQLILVRHGPAETPDLRQNDAERCLTSDGRKKMQQAGKGLSRLLAGDKDRTPYIIFSSPLVRAWETARILADCLNTEVVEQECLANGHLADFMQLLAKQDHELTVLAVGHQPHLGDWCQELTGFPLPFKKGAAASLTFEQPVAELMHAARSATTLRWFLQPAILRQLGK